MAPNIKNNMILEKLSALHRQRREILSMPAEKALDAVLDSPQPAALVHSFSEEDLYFLIHDVGLEDALPLIALASKRQWEYFIDIEIWEKDRMRLDHMGRWFNLLLKADANRFLRWLVEDKKEIFQFYLFKHIQTQIREHDQDPSELGDDCFTYDDLLYIKFIDPSSSETDPNDVRQLISRVLDRLSETDYYMFQGMLLESTRIIPAETEDEEFRLRNVRLAEKGFLPFHEAVGIYQPMTRQDLEARPPKSVSRPADPESFFPAPLMHARILEKTFPFVDALSRIEPGQVLDRLQSEFAGLCNQIIAADQKPITRRDELRLIVNKACGYISIGMAQLSETQKPKARHPDMTWIQRFPLSDIFRVGYGRVLELHWKAEKWRRQSWFESRGLPLSFWGEEWLGVLGGLLIKKPMYFDNYRAGVLYREFYSMDEIDASERTLNDIFAVDTLFSRMAVAITAAPLLTYQNVLLTLWARHTLNLSEDLVPMSVDEFERFYETLWSSTTRPPRIRLSMKDAFLKWLAGRTGLEAFDISAQLGEVLNRMFDEMEAEYQHVSAKDLDPKYILFFLVRHQ